MLIAQALAEYGALSAVVEAFGYGRDRLDDALGEWGVEGLILLIAVAVVWKVVTSNQRL